jgi:hypothetical protein
MNRAMADTLLACLTRDGYHVNRESGEYVSDDDDSAWRSSVTGCEHWVLPRQAAARTGPAAPYEEGSLEHRVAVICEGLTQATKIAEALVAEMRTMGHGSTQAGDTLKMAGVPLQPYDSPAGGDPRCR